MVEVFTADFTINTAGNGSVDDITAPVRDILRASGMEEGQVTVFAAGSTVGVSTLEYEPGLIRDVPECMERIVPRGSYHHHATWGDDNGHAHIASFLVKPSLTVPFAAGELLLGTWQQIVLVDFDTRKRVRKIIAQCVGIKKGGAADTP